MLRAGLFTGGKNGAHIQIQDTSVRLAQNAHRRNSVRAGERLGKQISRSDGGKQIAVAPEILLQDLCLAGQKNPGKRNSVSRTQQKLSAPEA